MTTLPIAREIVRASLTKLTVVALALSGGAVSAQDNPEGAHLAALRACQNVVDNSARLACYDSAVAQVVSAADAGDIQMVDREDIRETRRGLFGFSLPKLGIFGGDDNDNDELIKKMNSQITAVRAVGRESWQITVTEGSVWLVNDAHWRFRPKVGDQVELERAAMGSYWLRIKGENGVKSRRIE